MIQSPRTVRVLMPSSEVFIMRVDQYLRGVLPAEIGAEPPIEAARALAVAARSYAVTQTKHKKDKADICTETHCQAWRPRYARTCDEAIEATAGEVLVYEGRIVPGFYFAWCDGVTRDPRAVWQVEAPWCQPVPCQCADPRPMHDHGVGLCQIGALRMATAGADYLAILRHYYRDVEIVKATYA